MQIGERILIVGCPGSGKSTFARALAAATGLPLIHLDNIWWKPDRTHITRDEFDRELGGILRKDRWIIDGDYSRTYDVRIRACDTVLFLDYSPDKCLEGIAERIGKARTDIPWTADQPDPALTEEVRKYRSENRPVLLSLLARYPDKNVVIFRDRTQADDLLRVMNPEHTMGESLNEK